MKKILALLAAAAMLVSFAACGNNADSDAGKETEANATVGTTVETTVAENTSAEETSAEDESTTAEETSAEAITVEATTANEEETTLSAAPSTKAEIVKFYNDASAKMVSSKPGFKKVTKTELQKLEMGALGKIELVRNAIGVFLGEGTNSVTVAKGKSNSDSYLKSSLTAADVTSATCVLSADGTYYDVTIEVKHEKNPIKGKSALNRFTNDYKDKNEMSAGLKSESVGFETLDGTISTSKIKAKITLDGEFKSIDYAIKMDMYITNVKYTIAKVKTVTGTIATNVSYTGFAY